MQQNQNELVISRFKADLESMISRNSVDFKQLHEILEKLGAIQMDLDILKKTKIGLTVNNVRKTFKNSQEVAKATAELIRRWKKIAKEEFRSPSKSESSSSVDVSCGGAGGNGTSPASNTSETSNSKDQNQVSPQYSDNEQPRLIKRPRETTGSLSDSDEEVLLRRPKKSRSSSSNSLGSSETKNLPSDSTRAKSVKLIEDALRMDAQVPEHSLDPGEVAVETEAAIFAEYRQTDRKYKSRVRSRVLNLRDSNNPGLRRNVLVGRLSARKLAEMSSEEMASEEMRRFRESVNEESLKEHEMPDGGGSVHSDMFHCRKCNNRDTTYTISQERQEGEYEPVAVTLVVCNMCGNRWKSY